MVPVEGGDEFVGATVIFCIPAADDAICEINETATKLHNELCILWCANPKKWNLIELLLSFEWIKNK